MKPVSALLRGMPAAVYAFVVANPSWTVRDFMEHCDRTGLRASPEQWHRAVKKWRTAKGYGPLPGHASRFAPRPANAVGPVEPPKAKPTKAPKPAKPLEALAALEARIGPGVAGKPATVTVDERVAAVQRRITLTPDVLIALLVDAGIIERAAREVEWTPGEGDTLGTLAWTEDR